MSKVTYLALTNDFWRPQISVQMNPANPHFIKNYKWLLVLLSLLHARVWASCHSVHDWVVEHCIIITGSYPTAQAKVRGGKSIICWLSSNHTLKLTLMLDSSKPTPQLNVMFWQTATAAFDVICSLQWVEKCFSPTFFGQEGKISHQREPHKTHKYNEEMGKGKLCISFEQSHVNLHSTLCNH